jgi:hypothetical protein
MVALAAAACDAPTVNRASVSPLPAPSYIAWRALPASNIVPSAPVPTPGPPIPIPAGTSECTAGQLEARLSGQLGAAGHVDSPVDFRNRGAAPCYLAGFPDITILDGSGKVIDQAAGDARRQTFFGDPPVVPILLETGTPDLTHSASVLARPKGQAEIHIEWHDCRSPQPARLRIDLPDGGGRLTVDYPVTAPVSPACGAPAASVASLARGPFTPTGMVWPAQPKSLSLAVTLSAPPSIKRGSTLTYFVSVMNNSDMDYALNPCPDYLMYLGDTKPIARYQLNCGTVGHIAPGSVVTFEMRLRVPTEMVAGSYDLSWAIVDGRVLAPQAKSVIDIT